MRHLRISALAMATLLAACTEGEKDPMPGASEAVLQSHTEVWRANENRAFDFEIEEWRPDDTTTYACESRNGAVGRCVKVRRCFGEDPEVDTVNGYVSPTGLLARRASTSTWVIPGISSGSARTLIPA